MKTSYLAGLAIAFSLLFASASVFAKADVVELYTNAIMTRDIPVLEKLLAPNYWNIAGNGHIRDKEHFIAELKDGTLTVDRITFTNSRETKVGDTRLLTGTGIFRGKANPPRPEGMMRYTLVVAENGGKEQIVLFQATPVIGTPDCPEGNCKIN